MRHFYFLPHFQAQAKETEEKGLLEDETKKQQQLQSTEGDGKETVPLSAATISVRNSLPHVLPGILLR